MASMEGVHGLLLVLHVLGHLAARTEGGLARFQR